MSPNDTPRSDATPYWRNDAGLAGRNVVVTGATGGIGAAVCQALGEAGAHVIAVDRNREMLDALVAGLAGVKHAWVEADVCAAGSSEAILGPAAQGPGLAAVIHLAAVLIRRETVDDVTEDDWDAQLDTNLKASFFLNRAAKDVFAAQRRGGAIVNCSSQGWWTGGFGGSVVYSASKGGLVSMTRGLARSFAPVGVRVNAIAPGGVDTTMLHGGQGGEAVSQFISMIPMGRLAAPEELAGSFLFLASDASRYITGATLNVSGGQLMY